MKLINQRIVTVIAACMVSLPVVSAPFYLGQAANFNAYVLENMQGNASDVEGRLAVGGDLTLNNYGLGLQLASDNQHPVVTVGGDVSMRNARIYHGDAVAAGNIDIDASVGLYGTDAYHNTHQFYQDSSFDFASTNDELMYKSSLWGSYGATAPVIVDGDSSSIWNLTLAGDQEINIFSIDAATLSASGKGIFIDVPQTSYNIINVYGESVELFNTGFHLADGSKFPDNRPEDGAAGRHDGSYANNLLFNFVDATDLSLHGIGFKGSILAPLADTSFFNGHIDGNLIVKNLFSPEGEQTGQINNYQFGDIADISEPATLTVALGLLAVLGLRRRSLKRIPG